VDQPSRSDFVAVESSSVVAEDSSQAEVGDLELSRATNEQIRRLQITMHDVVVMAKRNAFQQHQHVALYLRTVDISQPDSTMVKAEILCSPSRAAVLILISRLSMHSARHQPKLRGHRHWQVPNVACLFTSQLNRF